MNETSAKEFESSWCALKKSSNFCSHKQVLNYFEKRLLPTFKNHSSTCIWVLKSAGVSNPQNGITNNPSESLNAVLHSLQNWKQVPLDVVCVSLFHLCSYYVCEITRGIHQCGSLEVSEEHSYYQRDPTLMPQMVKVIDPEEIVDRAKGKCLLSSASKYHDAQDVPKKSSERNTQLGLAFDAVDKKYVSLVDTGCWLVKGTDGLKPYVVTLLPTEGNLFMCC